MIIARASPNAIKTYLPVLYKQKVIFPMNLTHSCSIASRSQASFALRAGISLGPMEERTLEGGSYTIEAVQSPKGYRRQDVLGNTEDGEEA